MSLLTRSQYLRALAYEAKQLRKPRAVVSTYGASHLWPVNSEIKALWMTLITHKVPTTILVGLPHADSDDHIKHITRAKAVAVGWPALRWLFTLHSHAKYWILYEDERPVLGAVSSVNLSDSNIFDLGCEVRGAGLKVLSRFASIAIRSATPFDKMELPKPHPEWQTRVMGVQLDDATLPSSDNSPAAS